MQKFTFRAICAFVLLSAASSIWSYEDQAHRIMSHQAYETADWDVYIRGNFPWERPPGKYEDALMKGAVDEDVFPRSTNHFFNPLTGAGLSAPLCAKIFKWGFTCAASPDWIIEGLDQDEGEIVSYDEALWRYYLAVTSSTKAERDAQARTVFEHLGHVIHHLQDMAQPQHVRDDGHCDDVKCQEAANASRDFGDLYRPSAYERYSEDFAKTFLKYSPAPVFDVSDPNPAFLSARDFWKSSVDPSKGIATITSASFVSYNTGFRCAGTICIDDDEFPDPAYRNSKVVTRSGSTLLEYPKGSGKIISRASAFSFLTQDSIVWTQSSSTYAEMNKYLVPQAISYSAGLINFFFRGDIFATMVNNEPLTIYIGGALPAGVFEIYYDDLNYVRHKWDGWQYQISAAVPQTQINTGLMQTNLPVGIEYTVVFRPLTLCTDAAACTSDPDGAGLVTFAPVFTCFPAC